MLVIGHFLKCFHLGHNIQVPHKLVVKITDSFSLFVYCLVNFGNVLCCVPPFFPFFILINVIFSISQNQHSSKFALKKILVHFFLSIQYRILIIIINHLSVIDHNVK